MAEYSVDDREYPEGELRAEITRLTAERDEAIAELQINGDLIQTIKDNEDEIERLTADANRYALIRDHLAKMHSPDMGGQHGWRFRGGWPSLRGQSFDAAIDAAIVKVAAEHKGGE